MKGYWKPGGGDVDGAPQRLLYTGDIAKMDADGFFYIVDRKKEMIIAAATTSTRARWKRSSTSTRRSRRPPATVCRTSTGERQSRSRWF